MMMRRFMRIFLLVFVCVYVAPKTLRCHRVNVNFESGRLPFGIARFRFGEIATKTGRNGTRSNSVPSFGHRFAAGVRTGPMHMSRRWSGSQHLLLGSASQQPRRFESMAVCNLMNLFWRNLFCLPRKLLILHRICCPAYRFIRKSSPIQCSNLCWPNSSRTNVAKSRRPHLDPKLCNFIRKIRSKMPKISWKLGSLFFVLFEGQLLLVCPPKLSWTTTILCQNSMRLLPLLLPPPPQQRTNSIHHWVRSMWHQWNLMTFPPFRWAFPRFYWTMSTEMLRPHWTLSLVHLSVLPLTYLRPVQLTMTSLPCHRKIVLHLSKWVLLLFEECNVMNCVYTFL